MQHSTSASKGQWGERREPLSDLDRTRRLTRACLIAVSLERFTRAAFLDAYTKKGGSRSAGDWALRKLLTMERVVQEGAVRTAATGRPAALYRARLDATGQG